MAAALRRTGLAALRVPDLELVREGVRLMIRHSKTDQEGARPAIAVPAGKVFKPVAPRKAWRGVRGEAAGPPFLQINPQGHLTKTPMSDRSVARLVQRYGAGGGV